jgi:hypothetical protein
MRDEIADALGRLFNGYAILFLGSGFSYQATNKDHENLPTGTKLAQLLKQQANITGDYPLDILSREYIGQLGEHRMLALLQERLTAAHSSQSQRDVLAQPWRRIYTTNYDNVVELCAGEINKKILPVTLRQHADADRSLTQCVHLNGRLASVSIKNFVQEIKLTRASYLTDTFLSTTWLATFRADLALSTAIFFVGFSMYDIDVARIIYEDPMLKQKTYFVDATDLDPILARELAQYGTVFPIGLDQFSLAANEYRRPPAASKALTAFSAFLPPEKTGPASGDDVRSLLIRGEARTDLVPAASIAGAASYIIDRVAVTDVLTQIGAGGRRFLIHGDLGNGKTTLLHVLRVKLAQSGFSVLDLKQSFDAVEEDIRTIASAAEKCAIIVEDIYRNSAIVKKLCYAAPNTVVIATARSSVFDLRNTEVEEIFDGEFFEHEVNLLRLTERNQLIELANQNGLWGDLSARSLESKHEFIVRRCGNEIRSFLIHLLETPSFKESIRTSFYAAADEEILAGIAVILFLDVAHFDPDLFVVSQLSGVDFLKVSRLKKNPTGREYLEFDSGKVRVKSAILAQFILKEIFDYDLSLRFLTCAIQNCETAKSDNDLFGDMQKELMKFSFIDRIFSRAKDAGRYYVRFYDTLRTLPSMARNPQFWLQYAIARLEHSEFKSADTLFRTAYSHANAIKGYNPFQIDNHYARYLLVSRASDRTYVDFFRAFLDAHALLMKQARTEPNAYYPFKVARFYRDFVANNMDRLTGEQKGIMRGSIDQMISQIDHGSRHILRYRLVQECRDALVEAKEGLAA